MSHFYFKIPKTFNNQGFHCIKCAHITKAEFDALKSSFQSQIDEYNTSIDSKIDGAIAAYLAGIKLAVSTEENFFDGQGQKVLVCNTDSIKDIKWEKPTLDYRI